MYYSSYILGIHRRFSLKIRHPFKSFENPCRWRCNTVDETRNPSTPAEATEKPGGWVRAEDGVCC